MSSIISSNNSYQWYFLLFVVSSVTVRTGLLKFEMSWLLYMLLKLSTNQNRNVSCCGFG